MIGAIVQARMGSTRLPGKVMKEVLGSPLLYYLIERLKQSKYIEKIVVATTVEEADQLIFDYAVKLGVDTFRGNEDDVLDRYYQAAKKYKIDTIVRITADCPLICPEVIDKVISEYLKDSYDYTTNTILYTYPDGCDVEVFSFQALERAWKECKDYVGREHVTPYISNSGKFKIKNVENENPVNPNDFKWSVDRVEDFEFVREVYEKLYDEKKIFSYRDIMDLLDKHPEIKSINKGAIMNEGYYRNILKSTAIKPKEIQTKKSLEMKRKAEKLIPGCSQTFSKGPSQFVQGSSPVFLERGQGSHVWDVDGNEFIDYSMALGPIILGHNYPAVSKAVKKVLEKGTSFSLPHRLEVEFSELLCEIISCAEMVRFGKNGSDATSGAVRVARAYTERDIIACCGYHGWQDWYIGTTTLDKGIPDSVKKLTLTFKYNKIETLEKIFDENKDNVACVIMEPVGGEEPKDNFLQKVKDLTHKNGALLIFDEVITGFRLALNGAQGYFGVTPDLACFGKAMGNGFPISAVVGKKGIMKLFEEVFYSFTFGGEIASITAAIATIRELKEKNVIVYLWEQGRKIRDGYNVLAREYGLEKYSQCIGLPPRTVVTFKNKKGEDDWLLKSLFQQECIKRGILFTGAQNICFSHSSADIEYTLCVYHTVMEIVADALSKGEVKKRLEGEPVEPVFRKL